MTNIFARVSAYTIALGASLGARGAQADDAQWYRPQQVDSALKPAAETQDAATNRIPYVVRAELSLAGYGDADVGERTLRIRIEQPYYSVFIGAVTLEETAFEVGAELNTGGLVLKDLADAKISLMTPALGLRYLTETETQPSLAGLMFAVAGLRYCRCQSSRPLTIDLRAPVYHYLYGESEEQYDPYGNTFMGSTIDISGWGASFSVGLGF